MKLFSTSNSLEISAVTTQGKSTFRLYINVEDRNVPTTVNGHKQEEINCEIKLIRMKSEMCLYFFFLRVNPQKQTNYY